VADIVRAYGHEFRLRHGLPLSHLKVLQAIETCRTAALGGHRDRKDGDQRKIAEVSADEFLRRFLRHVLPKGFLRIRHYGLLANRRKAELLERSRTHLGVAKSAPLAEKTTAEWIMELIGIDVTRCPKCGSTALERIEVPPLRVTCFKAKPAARDTS
jgi:hypothetical protein